MIAELRRGFRHRCEILRFIWTAALDRGASCPDEPQNPAALMKSTSEFSNLRLPEVVVFQRRSVTVASVDSSGKVADRLRRVVVSLHPGHADSERRCLLKHSDDMRRYVADNDDGIKLLPAELTDETQPRRAPRASGAVTEYSTMRRSRSESAVGVQPLTRCRSDVIQSRDPTAPTNNVDEDGRAENVIANTQRPLAADNAVTATTSTGDVIVADVDEDNAAGNPGQGEMSRSASGTDKFKGLIRKHGAAFQVAGMLRATREDRQQKAFNSVRTESKAVKVLGTMFAIFVTCWAPFFTANLMMGVCSSCYVDPLLFKV